MPQKDLGARRSYRKAHYAEHREEILARATAWYEENRERKAAYDREYRQRNLDRRRANDRAYRERSRSQILAQRRDYASRNSAELNAANQSWRRRVNASTAHSAVNRYQRWSPAEDLAIMQRGSKTMRSLSIDLGRTYAATCARAELLSRKAKSND